MRTCHSCQRELDATATVKGQCPHCGAKPRKISQRTIDDTRLRDDKAPKEIELIIDGLDESIDLETTAKNQKTTEANQGGATIELQSFFDLDRYRDKPTDANQTIDSVVLPPEPVAADPPKTPTIPDRSDMTMEFQTLPSVEPPKDRKRHSTHSLESDKTIDLAMSPAEVRSSIRNGAARSTRAPSRAKRFASAKRSRASDRRCR